jgi:hypothetical protein
MLIINQVVAHPELQMTAFVAMGFYAYSLGRNRIAALLLLFAALNKQTAILVLIFVSFQILFSDEDRKSKIQRISVYIIVILLSVLFPKIFIDNATFKFDLYASGQYRLEAI